MIDPQSSILEHEGGLYHMLVTSSGTQATVTCELVQLEDGDTPTSLIPTNGTPVTRAAD